MRRSDAASKSHFRARRCMHPFRSTELPFCSFRMCFGHTLVQARVASLVNHLFFFFLVRLRSRISLGRSAHAERSPVVRPGRNAIWLRPRQWHAHTDNSVRRHSMLHVQSETSLKPIRMCFLFAARRTQ